ncbi:MAG: hypothetical protein QME64_06075, partial [bacterium]|nr:hypothetical protein [bacterium]
MAFSTGLDALDKTLRGILPGDNIVWQVELIDDYLPFVQPFVAAAEKEGLKLIYFRFAQHKELISKSTNKYAKIYKLHPEDG